MCWPTGGARYADLERVDLPVRALIVLRRRTILGTLWALTPRYSLPLARLRAPAGLAVGCPCAFRNVVELMSWRSAST